MSKEWTLKDPKPMGENDVKYGQTWWSYTHDSDMPLMFNLMDGAVEDGSKITAEEWVNKESAKGTEYLRLRKVKILSGSAPKTSQNAPESATGTKLLELIYEDTQKILKLVDKSGYDKAKEVADTLPRQQDEVAEYDIGEDPIDTSSIPF